MISRGTRVWLYALAAIVAGACGPDGCVKPVQQCPPGVKCITYDEYCDQANQSLWTMGQVCGVIANDVPYPTAYPQRDRRCTDELARLVDAGAVSFNAVAAELCIESRKTTCDPVCRWNFTGGAEWNPNNVAYARCSAPCDRIFTGIKEIGEACSLSSECLDGLWCDATKSCPGRCARQISVNQPSPSLEACRSPIVELLTDGGLRCDDLVDAGGGCGIQGDEYLAHHCQPGFACQPQPPETPDAGDGGAVDDGGADAGESDGGNGDGGADGGAAPLVCVPWPDAGAIPPPSCYVTGCPFGQYCTGDFSPQMHCLPFGARGAECNYGATFEPIRCQGGLQCVYDGGSEACGTSTAGSPCSMGTGVAAECAPDDYCGADGGCLARVGITGSCPTGFECQSGLLCIVGGINDAGTCFTPSLGGGACGDPAGHQCGYGFDCNDGGCVANACLPSP